MNWRKVLWSALGAAALFLIIGGGWILTLPPAPSPRTAPAIAKAETDAAIAALKPPKRPRPLIAIVGITSRSIVGITSRLRTLTCVPPVLPLKSVDKVGRAFVSCF